MKTNKTSKKAKQMMTIEIADLGPFAPEEVEIDVERGAASFEDLRRSGSSRGYGRVATLRPRFSARETV
jgi:hypothetical protein